MLDCFARRCSHIASTLRLHDEILIVAAGMPVPLPENSDQSYPFIAHSEYFYLTGESSAGGIVAFDPRCGPEAGWVHFVPDVSEAEAIWEGKVQAPGRPLREFDAWLATRIGRPVAALGAPLRAVAGGEPLSSRIRILFTHARRSKDPLELDLLHKAAAATAAGFARARSMIVPGISERSIQIELEAEFLRNGADQPGFGTIVGAGPDSAVLHFPPGSRTIADGDFVLIDAGAQVNRYTADVTRTSIAGTPAAFQRDLYQVVLAAQEKAIARCRPGTEWKDIHIACAIDLMAGLASMGIVRGEPERLFEREAHALFFPHGLGHMLGLGVRDASGLAPGRTRDPRACLASLRMDLPLLPGYVVTIEPGLYFIPPLLSDPARRAKYRDCVNWELVDRHMHAGGVRIEDDVLVTSQGPEVLTAMIPKNLG
ncbi:MAG: aminopeptidase P N-terminal domain-containing protein [Opitutaceae bacterium]|jgi:Xaa-Pro aminopeptidase